MTKRRRKPTAATKPEAPPCTLLDVWRSSEEFKLAAYAKHRAKLPLRKRLDELLRSSLFIEGDLFPKNAADLESARGDGLLAERRELQLQALAHCETQKIPRASICWIGEAARDARRRFEVENALLPHARQWNDDTEAIRKWVNDGRHIAHVIEQRTRGVVDDPAGRLRLLLKEVHGFAEAAELLLPTFDYRHPKAGRHEAPWAKTAYQALRGLGIHSQFCDYLLMAWCLKPYKDS